MSIKTILSIPKDTKYNSFEFAADQLLQLTKVSKGFLGKLGKVVIFQTLANAYEKKPLLKALVDQTEYPKRQEEALVRKVYENVIKKAKEWGDSKAQFTLTLDKHGSTLSPDRLEEIAQWIRLKIEAQSTLTIFLVIAEQIPAARLYCLGLPRTDTVECKTLICQWMRDNQEKLTIEELNLSSLSLEFIPKEIGLFRHLKELSLAKNNIKELPVEITNLPLKSLYLSFNRLTRLPAQLYRFDQLKVLDVGNNPNIQLEGIDNLLELQRLYLDNNQLEELPAGIQTLPALTYLNLRNNLFTQRPPQLRPEIEVNLSGNPII